MSKRRANLEGKYEKTPSGNWKCIIRVTVGGKIHYITGTAKTKTEASKRAQENLERKGYAFTTETDEKEERMKTVEASFMEFFQKASSGWQDTTKRVRLDFYKIMILDKIGHICVKDLKARDVNDMISSWPDQYCNDNISKSYSFLIKYLKDRMKKGVIKNFLLSIDDKPKSSKDIRRKNAKTAENTQFILSDEEYSKLLRFSNNAKGTDAYHSFMFLVMLYTGMRGQELRALTTKDIDFKKHTINIYKAVGETRENGKIISIIKATKNDNSTRKIGITPDIESLLLLMIEERPNPRNKLIVQNSHGEILRKRSFEKMFDKILRKAGIEKLGRSPHSLRHTFISWAMGKDEKSPLKDKEDLFISNYVGHNSLRTTLDIYSHVRKEKLADVEYDIKDLASN